MAYVAPNKKAGYEEAPEQKIHRIRITLTSRNVQNLEKGGEGMKRRQITGPDAGMGS